MRGMRIALLTVAVVSILAAARASAEDPLALPVYKETRSGATYVKFDGVTYKVVTAGHYSLFFEAVDRDHHRFTAIPALGEPVPYDPITLQWSEFPPVTLELLSGGDNSWMIGVETGYAEK